jgi:hypothetical protein
MLSWIIQITIVSIILIFLVHYLFNFFKETLTVPKIKDLVNVPNKKYENMFNIISKTNETSNYTDIDLLPIQPNIEPPSIENNEHKWNNQPDTDSMKNELKSFLKKQFKESSSSQDFSSDISSLNITSNSNLYSYSDF